MQITDDQDWQESGNHLDPAAVRAAHLRTLPAHTACTKFAVPAYSEAKRTDVLAHSLEPELQDGSHDAALRRRIRVPDFRRYLARHRSSSDGGSLHPEDNGTATPQSNTDTVPFEAGMPAADFGTAAARKRWAEEEEDFGSAMVALYPSYALVRHAVREVTIAPEPGSLAVERPAEAKMRRLLARKALERGVRRLGCHCSWTSAETCV